jgi:hypothetical protein
MISNHFFRVSDISVGRRTTSSQIWGEEVILMPESSFGPGDVGPGSDMQQKYGWFAENRSEIRVERTEVPAELQDLIPYAERWAIRCDVTRGDYFDQQSESDIRDLARTVGRREKEINSWLDSQGSSLTAAGFHFLYLLSAWSEAACEFPDEVAD